MSTIQITVAMAFIPFGFVCFVWGIDRQDVALQFFGLIVILIAMVSWYTSLRSIKEEQKQSKAEREYLKTLIKSIAKELRGLRKDLRSRKNEQRREPK